MEGPLQSCRATLCSRSLVGEVVVLCLQVARPAHLLALARRVWETAAAIHLVGAGARKLRLVPPVRAIPSMAAQMVTQALAPPAGRVGGKRAQILALPWAAGGGGVTVVT